MLKKAGFFLVLIILLSIGIFAQGFGFDFQYGGSRSGYVSSGVAGAITSALDIIFGGVVGPLFDAIEFNFYGATKLALWIILYLIFSNIFKNYFSKKGMHNKFSKVIAAIMALFSVVFIPASVLDLVFRDMLGGLVGILLLAAVIGFPLYYLFKWSRENREDRAVNLVSALLFFLFMIVFSQLNNQFVFAFTNGLVQSITSLVISFGILFALIMCIHRAYLGFKGIGGGSSRADAEESERLREDKFKEAKALAQQAVRQLNLMGQSIDSLSNDANGIAHQLTRQPRGLDFANRLDLTNLDNTIERLANILNKNNKVDLANEILQEHNRMNEAVNHFIPVRKHLETQLDHARRGHVDIAYFSDLINKIENLDSNIRSLARSLLKTGRL